MTAPRRQPSRHCPCGRDISHRGARSKLCEECQGRKRAEAERQRSSRRYHEKIGRVAPPEAPAPDGPAAPAGPDFSKLKPVSELSVTGEVRDAEERIRYFESAAEIALHAGDVVRADKLFGLAHKYHTLAAQIRKRDPNGRGEDPGAPAFPSLGELAGTRQE